MPVTNYIWDVVNDSLLMETDETGATTAVYTNEPVPYGRLISQRRGNTTTYYHFDGQGSTRQLTDGNQNVTDTYTYSAFGETVGSSGNTVNPFKYKGEVGYYSNPETGDLYVRARPYRPSHGRWIVMDPLGVLAGINLFTYARNNPILLSDSSGLLTQMIQPDACIANNKCGAFVVPAKWGINDKENDGFIIQKVCVTFAMRNCNPTAQEICTFRAPEPGTCTNKLALKPAPNQDSTKCYFELWRVSGQDIIAKNPFGNPPGPAGEGHDIDVFAFMGCRDDCGVGATKGRIEREGEAFYVPMRSVRIDQLTANFQTGQNGIVDACELASGTGPQIAQIYNGLKNRRIGDVRTKHVKVTFDCCDPCNCPNVGDTFLRVDDKVQGTGNDCDKLLMQLRIK